MKAFLVSFSFEHPENKGQFATSIALVYAENYEQATQRVNEIRVKNDMTEIPLENFSNATIE
jgi:hypothetical protein